MLGHRRHIVHAGFEQADLAVGGLDDRFTEGQRNRHDPVGEIPLAVLDRRNDLRRIEAATVAGKLTLNHACALQWYRNLVQATGCFLRIAHHVEQSGRTEVDLYKETRDESPACSICKLRIKAASSRGDANTGKGHYSNSFTRASNGSNCAPCTRNPRPPFNASCVAKPKNAECAAPRTAATPAMIRAKNFAAPNVAT